MLCTHINHWSRAEDLERDSNKYASLDFCERCKKHDRKENQTEGAEATGCTQQAKVIKENPNPTAHIIYKLTSDESLA